MQRSPDRNWVSCDAGRTLRLMLMAAATVTPILFSTGCGAPPPVPTDAQDACPLPAATFASWFQSGTVSLNGVVNPADSLNTNPTPDCGFYAWSEQMFMWLNSPAPSAYGGGAHIFDSPAFRSAEHTPELQSPRHLVCRFFTDTATTEIYTLSLHDALPIWSEQMFMWLNSPAPSAYGGGAHIFDSPAFFDVSPPDAGGNRTFIGHTAGLLYAFPVRDAQRGPHDL